LLGREAASLKAVVREFLAAMATASSTCVSPSTWGAPVTEEPGLRPRLPNIVVGPVLVTVDPPSTEKLAAVPRPTEAGAATALLAKRRPAINPRRTAPARTVFAPAHNTGRRLAARESLSGNSSFGGTPLFMGVS
jgi:hypothetical protein